MIAEEAAKEWGPRGSSDTLITNDLGTVNRIGVKMSCRMPVDPELIFHFRAGPEFIAIFDVTSSPFNG
jgi:hypothetical protein